VFLGGSTRRTEHNGGYPTTRMLQLFLEVSSFVSSIRGPNQFPSLAN